MGASRQFVDSFGFSWQAVELTRDTAGSGTSDSWLYFLARGTTRRLHAYPSDWVLLSWVDLEDLLTKAEVVGSDGSVPALWFRADRSRAALAR